MKSKHKKYFSILFLVILLGTMFTNAGATPDNEEKKSIGPLTVIPKLFEWGGYVSTIADLIRKATESTYKGNVEIKNPKTVTLSAQLGTKITMPLTVDYEVGKQLGFSPYDWTIENVFWDETEYWSVPAEYQRDANAPFYQLYWEPWLKIKLDGKIISEQKKKFDVRDKDHFLINDQVPAIVVSSWICGTENKSTLEVESGINRVEYFGVFKRPNGGELTGIRNPDAKFDRWKEISTPLVTPKREEIKIIALNPHRIDVFSIAGAEDVYHHEDKNQKIKVIFFKETSDNVQPAPGWLYAPIDEKGSWQYDGSVELEGETKHHKNHPWKIQEEVIPRKLVEEGGKITKSTSEHTTEMNTVNKQYIVKWEKSVKHDKDTDSHHPPKLTTTFKVKSMVSGTTLVDIKKETIPINWSGDVKADPSDRGSGCEKKIDVSNYDKHPSDLQWQKVQANPSIVASEVWPTFEGTLTNTQDGTVPAGSFIEIRYPGGSHEEEVKKELKKGETHQVSFTPTEPMNLEPGRYQVKFIADSKGQVDEFIEENNEATASFTVLEKTATPSGGGTKPSDPYKTAVYPNFTIEEVGPVVMGAPDTKEVKLRATATGPTFVYVSASSDNPLIDYSLFSPINFDLTQKSSAEVPLQIRTNEGATIGSITVKGYDKYNKHEIVIHVNIDQTFKIKVEPSSASILVGSSGSAELSVGSGKFVPGNLPLSPSNFKAVLTTEAEDPDVIEVSLSDNTISPDKFVTLKVDVKDNAKPGTTQIIKIFGTSNDGKKSTATFTVNVIGKTMVADFKITAPSSIEIGKPATIQIDPLNGFNQKVSLQASSGLVQMVPLEGIPPFSAIVTINSPYNSPVPSFTITGKSGSLAHTTDPITVTQPATQAQITYTIGPTTDILVDEGGSKEVTLSVTRSPAGSVTMETPIISGGSGKLSFTPISPNQFSIDSPSQPKSIKFTIKAAMGATDGFVSIKPSDGIATVIKIKVTKTSTPSSEIDVLVPLSMTIYVSKAINEGSGSFNVNLLGTGSGIIIIEKPIAPGWDVSISPPSFILSSLKPDGLSKQVNVNVKGTSEDSIVSSDIIVKGGKTTKIVKLFIIMY